MSIPRYWREIPQRYRLEATKCKDCGAIQIPAFKICPKCNSQNIVAENCPSTGKLVTYTVVYVAPEKFVDQAPYAIGIIELDNGARLTAQLTDCDFNEISVGMRLEAVFRRINANGESGLIQYGYKFRPLESLTKKR
ncbi:MAG: Zn-ribbon domain-containing OB-fold protein [Candidatus Ranarchaeia archaeon]